MNTSPLLLEPLADRSLNMAAIVLHTDPLDETGLFDMIGRDIFKSLTSSVPCLITDTHANRLPAECLQRLQESCCRIVPTQSIFTANETNPAMLPQPTQWISGRWYLAPPQKKPGNQSASRGLELKLLQLVANDAETREIEALFRQDPVLAYHLLRLVNSIGAGTNRHISSFSQAILILGRQQLKRWLNLMLFAANRDDQRSAMLMAHVAIRSCSMEFMAKACGLDRSAQEMAFMAGMFSMLGVLFGLPLNEILAPLNLSELLTAALLDKEGEIGHILLTTENAEQLDFAALSKQLAQLGVSRDEYQEISLEAHRWMLGVVHNQQGHGSA